ncbi:MAG TPA: hypothetical protein VK004_01040, partial [Ignavibacteria bacterium]|nr:hypothetical protein [Ignavibacteria bacterium]
MTQKKTGWLELWKTTLKQKSFRWELIISVIVIYLTLHFFSIFLLFAEDRPGVVMFDPILDLY